MPLESSLLEELLPEEGSRFPAQINVLRGRTLQKSGKWWKAVVLAENPYGRRPRYQLRLYGWVRRDDEWKVAQKFNLSAAGYLHEVVYILQSFIAGSKVKPKHLKTIEALQHQNAFLLDQIDKWKLRAQQEKVKYIEIQSQRIGQLESELEQFTHLLDEPVTETRIHNFLKREERGWMFGSDYQKVLHKTKLTVLTENDVLLERHDGFYDIAELKGPAAPLFTQDNRWHSEVSRAVSQLMKYLAEVRTHFLSIQWETSREGTKSPLDVYLPKGIVLIGRRTEEEKRLLRIHNEYLANIVVKTYDDLVDTAKQAIETFKD